MKGRKGKGRKGVQGYLTPENETRWAELKAALRDEMGVDKDSTLFNICVASTHIQKFDRDSKTKRLERIEEKLDQLWQALSPGK